MRFMDCPTAVLAVGASKYIKLRFTMLPTYANKQAVRVQEGQQMPALHLGYWAEGNMSGKIACVQTQGDLYCAVLFGVQA